MLGFVLKNFPFMLCILACCFAWLSILWKLNQQQWLAIYAMKFKFIHTCIDCGGVCSIYGGSTNWYVQNVSTFSNTFAIVSPLICVFWIQLTRTDAIFSRIAPVSRFCAEIQLSVKIREKSSKILFHQKTHEARRQEGEEAWGALTHWWRGPALAVPPWREEAPAILSASPLAYIYPLTT
jgi:hypothetical protein